MLLLVQVVLVDVLIHASGFGAINPIFNSNLCTFV
jgi:hypothetical protein